MMIVTLEEGQKTNEEELKLQCEDKIAKFKIPKQFIIAETLPYSAYGKVEKNKLKKIYLKGKE
jgi:acyl-CoA synthetase (AMP-forming)/AMP-acid ligase II